MPTTKDIMEDMNIVEFIQHKVNKLNSKHWSNDECKPIFIVSILYDYGKDKEDQFIILTVQHLGSSYSSIIFPRKEVHYGYESVLSEMTSLYNQTM